MAGCQRSRLFHLQHFIRRVRDMTGFFLGAYILRTDVELLGNHLSEWPKDNLCLPWKMDPSDCPVCYIPHALLDDVRLAAAARNDHEGLHWLGQLFPKLTWVQYNFFHPADTGWRTNPLYVIRGRPVRSDSRGKFLQHDLMQHETSEAALEFAQLSQSQREEIWSERVLHIARLAAAQGRDLDMEEFVNQWSRSYPDEALKWFLPGDAGPLKGILRVKDIQRVTDATVRIQANIQNVYLLQMPETGSGEQRKRKAPRPPLALEAVKCRCASFFV